MNLGIQLVVTSLGLVGTRKKMFEKKINTVKKRLKYDWDKEESPKRKPNKYQFEKIDKKIC